MAAAPHADLDHLRIETTIKNVGREVLTFVLKWGTNPPNPPISLLDYLNSLPPDTNYPQMTNKQKRNTFNNNDTHQINSDIFWNTFDISLLWKAIRVGCKNVAPLNDSAWCEDSDRLESLITKIKYERNAVAHTTRLTLPNGFHVKVGELRKLFLNLLDAAQSRYNIPDHNITQQKESVKDSILQVSLFTVEHLLAQNNIEMLHMFKGKIFSSVYNIFQNTQNINPLSFLSDSPLVHIQHIYSRIVITENQREVEIPHLEILGYTQSLGQPSQPQLCLLRADAGCGKSTLLAYITSEWLKDNSNRNVKYLDQYDVVLHILCRDTTSSSLQEFIERVLPDAGYFGLHTMKLIEKCKVLFLVDGLDERNNSSQCLVKDILDRGKDVPGWSILCTSRPEAVTDFVQSYSTRYGIGEAVMKGISTDDRVDFIVKYWNCFSGTGPDAGVVTQIEGIVWRQHFRLPLNLLFLTRLLLNNPSSVENTSQTKLYTAMLEWTKEKLQQRLAIHPESRYIDRDSRREGISKVLNLIGKLALGGLLQNRLSLSKTDKTQLRECCCYERLPSTEMLGAFYSVRSHNVDGKGILMYYAPHKSIQEFNAAQHIVQQIQESSSRTVWQLLLDTSQDPTQLANLVTGLSGGSNSEDSQDISEEESSSEGSDSEDFDFSSEPVELISLRNLLVHVLGLLSHREPAVSPLPGAIQEVVDLLHKTGMKKCYQWLELLEDTKVNTTALMHIAEHITNNTVGDAIVRISDTTITSAIALLPLIPCKTVWIESYRRQGHISQLGQATANHTLTKLYLYHHYKTPDLHPASDPILRGLPRRSDLERFIGHVSKEGLRLLQGCRHLEVLRLAVRGDDDAPTIVSTLTDVLPSLPSLSHLRIHIPVKTVTLSILTPPLPDVGTDVSDGVGLVLSGVEEDLLENTAHIAVALHPRKHGYSSIMFPGCNMKASGWKRLINRMANDGVRVKRAINVPDTVITQQEKEELNTLTTTTRMSCCFNIWSEDWLWTSLL